MKNIQTWYSFNEGLIDHIKHVRSIKKKGKEIINNIEKEKDNIIILESDEDNWKFKYSYNDHLTHFKFKFKINDDIYDFDYDRKETDILSEFTINDKEYFLSSRNANKLLKILKSLL